MTRKSELSLCRIRISHHTDSHGRIFGILRAPIHIDSLITALSVVKKQAFEQIICKAIIWNFHIGSILLVKRELSGIRTVNCRSQTANGGPKRTKHERIKKMVDSGHKQARSGQESGNSWTQE